MIAGRARVFGDDINTDYIITSRRKRESLDPKMLSQYIFEEIAPQFAATVKPGDLIVAGKNFGCGSAMEVAVTCLLGSGIPAVIAASFSRTYFRNAVNNGLFPVICDTSEIQEGNQLEIDLDDGVRIRNLTSGKVVQGEAVPPIMLSILKAGGLVPYFRRYGGFEIK
jgi:3-isopropylmalate/(R)-2-methylmalate dehydratase small subunit